MVGTQELQEMSSLKPIHALNLDSVQQQAFMKYFSSLTEKPPTTVRIFDRNDYYSVHGVDAAMAAKEVFSSTANIKKMGIEPNLLDYLVLSKGNMEVLLKKLLLVRRYRVEIYVSEGSSKSNNWSLKYKGSPGFLSQLEDVLSEDVGSSLQGQTPCLMAVNFKTDAVSKGRMLGVACVKAGDYELSVCEFTDDDTLGELEPIVVQLGPSECLVPHTDNDVYKALVKVMERSNIPVTKMNRSDFATEGLIQDLNRLLKFRDGQKQDANTFLETNKTLAMTSLAAAIKYAGLMSENTHFGRFRLAMIQADCFMHVDTAAMLALNVLPNLDDKSRVANRSLFALLDRCRTHQGKRLLAQWLRQPLRDINLMNERLDVVELLVNKSQIRMQLHNEHLRRIPDLQMLARRLTRKRANLQDCYKIYQAVKRLPELLLCLAESRHCTVHSSLAEPISELKGDLDMFIQLVEATIDMSGVNKGDFQVQPSFDNKLQTLNSELQRLSRAAQGELRKVAEHLDLNPGKTIKIENHPQYGFHFRVTRKEAKTVRGNYEYIIIQTLKACVRFKNDALDTINEEYLATKASYAKEQARIVTEIIGVAAGYSETLSCLSRILSRLDVLVAFSVAAASAPYPYCRPVITQSAHEFVLKDVRHPCVEVQEGVSYIPNDVEFKRGKGLLHIVTGANMGGKSTWMRSCGAAALLAHAGCMVPAKSAVIPRLKHICARVGACDKEDKGISTFMQEMIEIVGIQRTATPDSLVLIDELGRGTSTYDGCGIAWAIAEDLALQSQCFCLFATHYHALTRLALKHPGVIVNSHVRASVTDVDLLLLHKIAPGPSSQSMGLYIARTANLPKDVVKYAEGKQVKLEAISYEDEVNLTWQDITEGQEIVKSFIIKCKQTCEATPSDKDMMSRIKQLKHDLQKTNNKYVLQLIAKKKLF